MEPNPNESQLADLARSFTGFLAIQLALSFFFPPLEIGGRLVFLADFGFMAGLAYFGPALLARLDRTERLRLLRFLGVAAAVIGIACVHGAVRPALGSRMGVFMDVTTDDAFSAVKEGMAAFRFFCWLAVGALALRVPADRSRLYRVLTALAGVASLALLASKASVGIRSGLASLYRYDPDVPDWKTRAYGVFHSPIEANVAMCVSFLLVAVQPGKRWARKGPILFLIALGIAATKTLTSPIALAAALAFGVLRESKDRKTLMKVALIAGLLLAVALALFWSSDFLVAKRANLMFRAKPWAMYWEIGISRIDYLLFGTGFHPFFSDNLYLYFFSRGGALWLACAAWLAVVTWQNRAAHDPRVAALFAFFLLSGLTVDSLIIRPVVAIAILGVSVLAGPATPSKETSFSWRGGRPSV